MTRIASDNERCGAPTKAGGACRWPRGECRFHPGYEGDAEAAEPEPEQPRPALPDTVIAERDLHALGWWLVRHVLDGGMRSPEAGVVVSIMRVLHALGPAPVDAVELQRETQLRGRLMHGRPPQTEEEWALAEKLFDDEAMAEFRRWRPSGEVPRWADPEPAEWPADEADNDGFNDEVG